MTDSTPSTLTQRELSYYSVLRAVRAAADIARGNTPVRSLETELASDLNRYESRADGRSGFKVPLEVLATAVETGQSGGFLANARTVGPYGPIFRRGLVGRLGMEVVTGLTGSSVPYPFGSSGPSGAWVREQEDAPESQLRIREHELFPHTWSTYINLTRKMLKQTGSFAEEAVRLELRRAVMAGVDAACLVGCGALLEPLGILADDDITLVEIGDNGGAMSYSKAVEMLTAIGGNVSADMGLAWVTNNQVRGRLLQTLKVAEAGTGFMWEPAPVPGADGGLLNLPAYIADAVPASLVKGSSGANCSAMALGPWTDGLVGVWGQTVDLIPSRAELWHRGGLSLAALIDVDVAFRRKEGFVVCLDVQTV